jgi:hypothetical protein
MELGLANYGKWEKVSHYNYLGSYLRYLCIAKKYYDRKNKFDSLNGDYSSDVIYIVKDCLQNHYQFGIENGYKRLLIDLNTYENKLFDWLDKVDNPYYYIYYQAYEYNTHNNNYGLYPIEDSGITEFNHYIAKKYALRQIKQAIQLKKPLNNCKY